MNELIAINKKTGEVRQVSSVTLGPGWNFRGMVFIDGGCVPNDEWDIYMKIPEASDYVKE